MPGIDGTGPRGDGPMTGRGMGSCVLRFEPGKTPTITGFAGAAGRPIHWSRSQEKENQTMPRGDGTGPMGMGPMTGRATGYCAGYASPGYANPGPGRGPWGGGGRWGRGLGLGFRGGRGWGAIPYAYPHAMPVAEAPNPEQERAILQGQIASIESTLEGIRQRLSDLGTEHTDKEVTRR
ncbi:MAG: DUF5320 domain-containing protein [Victivallales bacterium]|nr:DUF5320 domain-containing protein [Victivallales bacterium]